jgi:hypothetical protein
MLRRNSPLQFRMQMGKMRLDFRLTTRDHARAINVDDAVVDTARPHSVAPKGWLELMRQPLATLPNGYYTEQPVYVPPPGQEGMPEAERAKKAPNAVRAGPLLMYVVGQPSPAAINIDFVDEAEWGFDTAADEIDLRVGRDVVEQTTLFSELRPGGLLSEEPLSVLKQRGLMQVGLAESPYARRPWTRMKTYFIDELQRGTPAKEFIGFNPRNGREWRFSQYCKHFRTGIWREQVRTKDLVEGRHAYSSYQRTHQQAVPEVRHMAPGP